MRSPYALPVIDDGSAIHYAAVSRGTAVYASDGVEVGKVDQVVDNYREHILDGIVIETASVSCSSPTRRRSRAPPSAVSRWRSPQPRSRPLPPPERGAGTFKANVGAGRLGRMFGRGWKRD